MIHKAGIVFGGFQYCVRCGRMLTDRDGKLAPQAPLIRDAVIGLSDDGAFRRVVVIETAPDCRFDVVASMEEVRRRVEADGASELLTAVTVALGEGINEIETLRKRDLRLVALAIPYDEAEALFRHLEHDALGYSRRGLFVSMFLDRLARALKAVPVVEGDLI